tara:strand:+ start:691 stop:1143 length:453 start_codon:yes stop_codon:yes gene_type:complete
MDNTNSKPQFIKIKLKDDIKSIKINKDDENRIVNFRNLIDLTNQVDLDLFKMNRNKWVIKDKRKLIGECKKKRKKKIRELTKGINLISKKNEDNISNKIKVLNEEIYNEINTIDEVISELNNNTDLSNLKFLTTNISEKLSEDFIEVFSN